MGDGWVQALHPEDSQRSFQTYKEAFEARREFSMEYRLRRRDGAFGWVLATGSPRFSSEGEFLGYVGTATDITELKQAEERWRAVVESASDTKLVLDKESRIVLANARAESMFGYTRAELIGKSTGLIFPGSMAEEVAGLSDFKDLTMNAGPVQVGGQRKDGAQLTLEATLNRMETGNGEFLLASLVDVTDRVASETK